MKISHEKIDGINAIIKVDLTPEDYNPQVDKVIKDQAKKAKIPGFRPGQVPAGHIRRTLGKSVLFDEVNKLVNDSITAYIAEQKLEVLGQPLPKEDDNANYNWDYKDNFSFTYEIGLAPEFTVPFTAESEFTEYDIKADDETLASRIKNLRRSYGKMTNPEVSAEGDVLYATLTQDGAEGIEKTASIRTDIIEDAKIKKSLVGLKQDDTVKIDLKKAFKEEDIARILGITAEEVAALKPKFTLKVNNVNRLEESELNQEFFDKLFAANEVTTEEQFTEKVKEEVENLFKQNSAQKLRNEMYTYGMAAVDVTFPEAFLKRWLKATNPNIADQELNEGFADFISNLKWTIIENRVVTENKLEVKYDEVIELAKERIYAQIKMYNINEEPTDEQLAQYAIQLLQDREQANRLFEEAKALKVYEFLKGVVKINTQEINYNEFEKLA